MVAAPVLRLPDFTQKFVIETNASNEGIGAVLMQQGHPIAYFSQKLGIQLRNSSVYIRKLHAVTAAVLKWRQYLLGQSFVIRTDHRSLKELLQQVIQTPDHQAYVRKLLGFQFRIEYKIGITKYDVDALSRVLAEWEDKDDTTAFTFLAVKPEKNSIFLKNGKTVISVGNRKFSKSQMTKQTSPFNSSREI